MRSDWRKKRRSMTTMLRAFCRSKVKRSRKEVEGRWMPGIRSSSLVENINSALRPLLATCRGQVDQDMLELFAYGHNHRRFVRGKRANRRRSRSNRKELEKTWLDSLLEMA